MAWSQNFSGALRMDGGQIGAAMWKKEDNVGMQPTPTLAMYTEAMNRFTRSASAFMQHVHLLTEARDAYQEAMSASQTLRRSLDDGDQTLRSLMTQLEQVVSEHFGDPVLDRKKLELVKDATGADRADTGGGGDAGTVRSERAANALP